MPMKEKGDSLDRLIGAIKIPGKGRKEAAQQDSALASMEVDMTLRSRIKSFPSSRKRSNAYKEENSGADELVVLTALNRERMPARLRLSVNRRSRDSEPLRDEAAETQESDHETVSRDEFPLTDRRRALFEPLGPAFRGPRDGVDDSLLPPPDFEFASYPRGWVVGKKRKLVNVDVVESMRRVAVHEMNRKDREINGLNEQLEEDSRTMEHLQLQLQQERTKRLQAERENNQLQAQINMLMNMLNEGEEEEEGEDMDGQ